MIPRKRAYLQGSSMISVLDATVRWPCIINGDVISWISWIINCSSGNFSWATEAVARKVRVIDVVYNASNNELVRTKTLVKGCIVTIDSTPFRQWYESHYAKALGRKKNAKLSEEEEALFNGPKSAAVQKKLDARRKEAEVAAALVEQFSQGRLLARIASRPGQTGRCDGYILEGKELDFYVRKLKAKKSK